MKLRQRIIDAIRKPEAETPPARPPISEERRADLRRWGRLGGKVRSKRKAAQFRRRSRKGGKSRSPAKVAAARMNGLKYGGRRKLMKTVIREAVAVAAEQFYAEHPEFRPPSEAR